MSAETTAPEYPPVMPLRLYGRIGGTIMPDHPEFAYLAEPYADKTALILAEWAAQDRRDHAGIWPLPQRRPAGQDDLGRERQVRAEASAPGALGAGRFPSPPPPDVRRDGMGAQGEPATGPPLDLPRANTVPPPPVPWKPGTVPPPVEEVMPHASGQPQAPGAEAHMSVPRPGAEPTGPGVAGTAEAGPGHPQRDGLAEQFGAPREPFWPDDKPRIVPPPETTEMTAITERPEQEQQ